MFTPILVSTGFLGYQALKQTEDAQRQALSNSAEVANETSYVKAQLGKVTSSDELLADRRLLEVALTAYGLESEIDKTAMIKRALDEGTTDEAAFANLLSDSKWVDFSADFGFGDLNASSNMAAFRATVETRFRDAAAAEESKFDAFKLSHFRANVGSITSVDDLLADPITLEVALAAFGLERGYYNDDHFRQLLTDGVDDSANDYAYSLDDSGWISFAAAFSGLADGGTLENVTGFRLDTERELARRAVTLYDADEADAATGRISASDVLYYQANADSVASGADLVADAQLREVTLVAYGLAETSLTDTEIATILDQAIAGDFSAAEAQSDSAWKQLATSFAASVNGGAASEVKHFEYAIELGIAEQQLESVYYLSTAAAEVSSVSETELAYFSENIEEIDSVSAFLADDRLVDVALRAFGLEDSGKSTSYIESILAEDPTSDGAFVNQLSDTRWASFSKAFNGVDANAAIWRNEIEQRLIDRNASDEDLQYLRDNWNIVSENLDLVLLPDLMDVVLSAFDIPKGEASTEFFVSMVISNPAEPTSLVNLYDDDRWKEVVDLMGSFVGVGGNTGNEDFQTELIERYEARSFEIAVGQQDQSMRLALNFERLISDYTEKDNWYLLLGDQPMRSVLDAAFGMPAGFVNLDIEDQNEAYGQRAQQLFGGDTPSVFADPDNITTLLRRYMVAQDAAASPSASTPGYGALSLMSAAASNARSYGAY
ncbi:MAG: DUF1217 domain-containing protein [Neomegalonema sp.]|nr:DUF1217 domain-containing protein [Neomegalonema sp.]